MPFPMSGDFTMGLRAGISWGSRRLDDESGFHVPGMPQEPGGQRSDAGAPEAEGLHPHAPTPTEAEVLVVNTCGFIESAKKESIEAILQAAAYKKDGACRRLVVAGCMVERYREQLLADMPEIDACLGTRDIEHIAEVVGACGPAVRTRAGPGLPLRRAQPAPAHHAQGQRLPQDQRRLRPQPARSASSRPSAARSAAGPSPRWWPRRGSWWPRACWSSTWWARTPPTSAATWAIRTPWRSWCGTWARWRACAGSASTTPTPTGSPTACSAPWPRLPTAPSTWTCPCSTATPGCSGPWPGAAGVRRS